MKQVLEGQEGAAFPGCILLKSLHSHQLQTMLGARGFSCLSQHPLPLPSCPPLRAWHSLQGAESSASPRSRGIKRHPSGFSMGFLRVTVVTEPGGRSPVSSDLDTMLQAVYLPLRPRSAFP